MNSACQGIVILEPSGRQLNLRTVYKLTGEKGDGFVGSGGGGGGGGDEIKKL
jgi:hypothetical protein